MITKIGSILLPIGAGGYGAFRASDLNEEQRSALRKEHKLDPEANLTARNAGRGVAGYFGGAIPGAMLGTVPGLLRRSEPLAAIGGMFGGLAGGITGAHMATNKYSKGRAKEIMAQE